MSVVQNRRQNHIMYIHTHTHLQSPTFHILQNRHTQAIHSYTIIYCYHVLHVLLHILPNRSQSTSLGGEFTYLTQTAPISMPSKYSIPPTAGQGQRQHAAQVMYNEVMHARASGIFLDRGWIEALHWVRAGADGGLLIWWFDYLCLTLEPTAFRDGSPVTRSRNQSRLKHH